MSVLKELLESDGNFTWSFSDEFFIKTKIGNYVWKDPRYGGDNTIRFFKGTYMKWCKRNVIPFGRDKGTHIIKEYCGSEIKYLS